MKLAIRAILLRNFKGIQDLEMYFDPTITKVMGRNGAGKSTIADGISYCLFGKDSKGNTQFGIKTRDVEGNEIPHLEHEAGLVIDIDGTKHTLSRILREKWTKPRGSEEEYLSGNVIEYYIDDEKVTKTDYERYISNIAADEIFRLLTNPSHFHSLPWQQQLEKLNAIVGDITPADIVGNDPRYTELLKQLEQQSVEAIRKHLAYQIREVKKKVDEMPVVISTLKQTLPEPQDWDTIQHTLDTEQQQLEELNQQILRLKTAPKEDSARYAIRHKLEFYQKRIDDMRQSKRNLARKEQDRYDTELRQAKMHVSDITQLQQQLTQKRMSCDKIINACNQTITEAKTKLQSVKEEGSRVYSSTYTVDESITVCPTCGQYLPEEQVKAAITKARADFNSAKAEHIKDLMNEMEGYKISISEAEQLKADTIADMQSASAAEQEAAQQLIAARKTLADLEQQQPPTVDALLAADDNYNKTLAEIQQMQSQLDNNTFSEADTTELDNLQQQYTDVQQHIASLRSKLNDKAAYDRTQSLISEKHDLWQQLNAQLTALEKQEDIIRSFTEKRDTVIESRINALFEYTRFRLYKLQVDNVTREPFCTATFHGVEYKDLNSAAKILVGLDIINAFSRYYDVSIPLVIDNAESITSIPDTIGQRIELHVSPDYKELTAL